MYATKYNVNFIVGKSSFDSRVIPSTPASLLVMHTHGDAHDACPTVTPQCTVTVNASP